MAVTLPGYQGTGFKFEGKTIGDIIGGSSGLLIHIYTIAGLVLLVWLISGGITLMTAGGDQAKTKEGYGKIKGALVGFLLVFVSYFVAQIVEMVLGVKFL